MKKILTASFTAAIMLMVVIIAGCGGDTAIPGVTSQKSDLLKLLPVDASGVMQVNFSKFAKLDFFDKMMKEEKESQAADTKKMFEDYEEFIAKTGIDPKKDIRSLAVAFAGEASLAPQAGKSQDFAAVIDLDYDKEKIMALLKEKGVKYSEETYKGFAILTIEEESQDNVSVCFLDNKTIAAGKIEPLKKVIDLFKGEGQSVLKNDKLKPYIGKFKTNVILSFVFEIPEKDKKVTDGGMFKMDLSKAEVLKGNFDYDDKAFKGVIEMISHNEQANKDLATTLTGLKGMGAMAGPEIAELVNNITITGLADRLSITVTVSDELAEKLKAKMDEQAKAMGTFPGE